MADGFADGFADDFAPSDFSSVKMELWYLRILFCYQSLEIPLVVDVRSETISLI